MIGGIRDVLSRMGAAVATALVAGVSAARVAFAAGTDSGLPPEYAEVLRLAEEKVNSATQPGAFGNGVPIMSGDVFGILPWLGVGLAAAVAPYLAAKYLVPMLKRESMVAQ